MDTKIDTILKRNQLSVTGSRKKILELFLDSRGALAHADIEKRTNEKFDRVTVYRTLQVFLEKCIIHNIPTSDNSIRYALCQSDCSGGHHHDNHVHFVCGTCGNTSCLEDVTVQLVKLPEGFAASDYQMVVRGTCKECKNN